MYNKHHNWIKIVNFKLSIFLSLEIKCEKWANQNDTSVEQTKESEPMTSQKLQNSLPLFTYHIHNDFNSADASSMQNTWHMNTEVKWPCSPWVLVAQWIEPTPGVREVMGLIPVGAQIFLCPMLVSCWSVHVHVHFTITNMYLEMNIQYRTTSLQNIRFEMRKSTYGIPNSTKFPNWDLSHFAKFGIFMAIL